MGEIEHYEMKDHKFLDFEDNNYAYTLMKTKNDKFQSLFFQLGSDPRFKIDNIVEKAAELMKTSCSLYNRLEEQGKLLRAWAACNLPLEFDRENIPDGSICYEETIKGRDRPMVIEDIEKTSYAETGRNFVKCGLKSYLGFPITSANGTIGSLCVMDNKIRTFSENELQIIATLAKALSQEEARLEEYRELDEICQGHHSQLGESEEPHNTRLSRSNLELKREKEAHKRTIMLLEKKEKELASIKLELEKVNFALAFMSKKKMKR